jgi:hypothetical protein
MLHYVFFMKASKAMKTRIGIPAPMILTNLSLAWDKVVKPDEET